MDFRVRDPVHNFIRLDDELVRLVGTNVLQRLRGIRQLALASLVYPGALHTRFDHTLGVTHVAGLMADKLKLKKDEKRLVQLAALLHDVGHGPFSHVSENSLVRFANESALKEGQKKDKIHELVTAEIIRTEPALCRLLKEETRNQVIQLLKDGYGRPILKQIVSGPLDADKQEYLLRDSKFCGVEYGVFDLHQLQRSLVPVGEDGFEVLMIDPDGVHAVEQFVMAKYYMTTNVYRHRVRLITDQMIGRAIALGIEIDKLDEMGRLYRFDNSAEFTRNYLKWDDSRFMEAFCPIDRSPPGPKSGEILRRLRERSLLKQVFSERIDSLDARIREMVKELSSPKQDGLRKKIEVTVAEYLAKQTGTKIEPDLVIVHSFGIKSVRESSKNEEEGILVNTKPTPKTFIEESTLFKSINEAYSDSYVEVYAPVSWPNPDEKDQLRESWKDALRDKIVSQCNMAKRNRP